MILNIINDFAKKELLLNVNLNSNDTYIDLEKKIILIHHKQTINNKCFSLLHELGHVIQPISLFQVNEKNINISKFLILEQEINAWDIGWLIAKHLKIADKLNYEDYVKESATNLKSYMIMINEADNKYIKTKAIDYTIKENERLPEWLDVYKKVINQRLT